MSSLLERLAKSLLSFVRRLLWVGPRNVYEEIIIAAICQMVSVFSRGRYVST